MMLLRGLDCASSCMAPLHASRKEGRMHGRIELPEAPVGIARHIRKGKAASSIVIVPKKKRVVVLMVNFVIFFRFDIANVSSCSVAIETANGCA